MKYKRPIIDSVIFYTILFILMLSLTFTAILSAENAELFSKYENAVQENYLAHRRMDDIERRQDKVIKYCKKMIIRKKFIYRKMRYLDVRI